MNKLRDRLAALSAERLQGIGRGIEKESLRARPDGTLALTPHPAALGAPLTHPHITTDYSESLIELVTGVHRDAAACLNELTEIHQVVAHEMAAIGDESLWVASMPCRLPTDENIPLGVYGTSNVGRAKSVYRMGLGHRYGRRMQTIAGIHYNWSLPGLGNDDYFGLIRNFRRNAFLLLVLFGASPVLDAPFVAGRDHGLQPLGEASMYLPHATSLRMGRLGYQSDAQASLNVSYNCLDSYANSLEAALTQPYPAYEAIGIRNLGGEYNQLATTLLQIENEFYGTIRPKRVIRSGERPLHALRERGVEYVEVRLMDLDPFETVGIHTDTARFLDLFLLHCLLTDSPPDTPQEIAALKRNQHLTAARGREPGLQLERAGQAVRLADWAGELLAQLAPIAQAMDRVGGATRYAAALARAQGAFKAFDDLPSARVLRRVREQHQGSYIDFVRACAQRSRAELLARPCPAALKQRFDALATESWTEQKRIEASDRMDFETFRRQYVSPERLAPGAQANMDSEAAI
ncbi:MAG: glutamate--cysteine ligase [Burkholderiaceae bacterium]|nr:glutamate--cysteine ligase [Burkholderiaceae bacterium]MCP5219775.1 glutamate--cysteine ligase [Burkholderiaceae bacterium]